MLNKKAKKSTRLSPQILCENMRIIRSEKNKNKNAPQIETKIVERETKKKERSREIKKHFKLKKMSNNNNSSKQSNGESCLAKISLYAKHEIKSKHDMAINI